MPTSSGPLRIGVLGAARISTRSIVAPAHETDARLVAVAARDRARAEAFAAEHGVERVVGSYEELLADPEVELVYDPLPNALHGPWNLAAVRAGKHVLSEKPFASDAAQAAEVRDTALEAGVHVVEAFHYPYHPLTRRLHDVVASGEIGDVRHVETIMMILAPDDGDPRWSFELAGGALMDLGCYGLHVTRHLGPWLGGEPSVLAARAGERAGAPGVDERFDVDLRYPSGASALAHVDMAAEHNEMSLRVEGTRGTLRLPNFAVPHRDARLVVTTDAGERTEDLGSRPSFSYQLEAVAALLRDGTPVSTDGDDAVATMTLIDECYRRAGLPPRARHRGAGT